jgi:Family of unknown function (DUF6226)
MPEYTRPAITAREFRDESGAVIRYGARWTGSPPDDSYSRVSNPERFAPLQTVANALIEHLRAEYRADIAALAESFTKLVTVTPDRADAAPLEFRFTDFPGVVIRAGVRCRAAFPACGCDACDDTWEKVADDMECLVFAVAEGTFVERIALTSGGTASVEYTIRSPNGTGRGGSSGGVEADAGLRDDAARLDRLPVGRWQPWPRKSKARSLS